MSPYDWSSEKVDITLQSLALKASRNAGSIWMTCDEYDHFRMCLTGMHFPGFCFGRRIAIVDTFDTMKYIRDKEAG